MSYKRISIRFNLDIEDERNAWELLHSSSCGPINKEVIDSINTAHKLSTLEALLRKVISEELRNISLHIPFEPDTDSASDENESSIMDFLESHQFGANFSYLYTPWHQFGAT